MNARGALQVLALIALGATPLGLAQQSNSVPAEECLACHEEAESFVAGDHGQGMRAAEVFEHSCEACHGSGAVHAEEMTAETIQRRVSDQACLSCHPASGQNMGLEAAAHQRNGLACLDCHDSGHGAREDHMLLREPRELCSSCHLGVAARQRLPFAHRDGLEGMSCLECHANHGQRRGSWRAGDGAEAACETCHLEAVPRVFEHQPVAVDGCASCHDVHGSVNPSLLTRRESSMLCLECHADVPTFHDPAANKYRRCTSCHRAVHGSDHDQNLFER